MTSYQSKFFVIPFILLFFTTSVFSADRNTEFLVEQFIASFSLFCNTSNNDIKEKSEIQLLMDLFEDPTIPIEYDLFTEKNLSSHFNANDYLTEIKTKYGQKIHISFYNTIYEDCTEEVGGQRYSFVTINKKLTFEAKSKDIQLVIVINQQSPFSPRINSIFSVEQFNVLGKKCIFVKNQKSSVEDLKKIADNQLSQAKMLEARSTYSKIITLSKDDNYAKIQMHKIDSLIKINELLKNIDTLLSSGQVDDAEYLINSGLLAFPGNIALIEKKSECKKKKDTVLFLNYKKTADSHFALENFTDALSYYQLALKIKDDNDVKNKISTCIYKNSPQFIKNEIARAKQFASKGKFKDSFKLFYKFDSDRNSDYFDGYAYYLMAFIAAGNYDNIKSKLDLSSAQLCHLARYYCIEARKKGNPEADYLWNELFNTKTRYCD